jgi:hypothetical protein
MGLSAIGRAEWKSSSTNGNALLKSGASARKMGAGPLVAIAKVSPNLVTIELFSDRFYSMLVDAFVPRFVF